MWRVKVQILLLLAISFGAVAQFWLEHRTVTSEVEGSSPFGPANYTPVAEPDYESGTRNWSWKCRFETCLVYYGLRLLWPSKNTGSYSSSQRIQTNEFLEFVGSFWSKSKTFIYASVAQLGAQRTLNPWVESSSLSWGTKLAFCFLTSADGFYEGR